MFNELTEETFILYAAKNYDNPQCLDIDEFYDDLSRFKYIKRLFRKYQKNNILQERLILNHIIVIYNVFGIEAANKMMFYKIDEEHWSYLKPFLKYLNFLKPNEYRSIPEDEFVKHSLEKI